MSELRPYQRDLIARAQSAFGLWRDPADGVTRTEARAPESHAGGEASALRRAVAALGAQS